MMNYFAFSALVNGLSSAFLGIYVLAKGRVKALNVSYAFFAFSTLFWSFGYFFWQISISSASALFWCRVLMAGAVLIPISYFNFSAVLCDKFAEKKKEIYFSCLVGFVFIFLDFTPLIVRSVSPKLFFNFWPEPGLAYPLFLLMFFFYTLTSLRVMYSVFKKTSGHLRGQILYVFWGTAIGFIGGSTNYFLWYDIPIPPVANILVLAYPLLLAYSITKHRLMDISVVINRTAAEVLTIIFLTTGYFGLVWIDRSFISKGFDGWFFGLTILYGIFVGNVHKDLRLFLQTTSTKLFLRGRYNYFKEMSKITSQISRCLSRENILKTLDYVFYDLMEAKSAKVYLSGDFDEPEVKALLQLENPTFKDDMLIVPCRYEGKPNAFIILGPKLSEDAYTEEDILLLKNLASQTAVALDHCRLCEEMLGAQKQLLMADKLSSLGKVAAGLAHEIKNPLTAIKGMTQGLSRNFNDAEIQADFMAVVPKEIDRLSGLIENLSNLGKAPKLQFAKVNVNLLLENNLKLFESRCRKQGINIVKDLGTLPEIEADGERLTQVFTNLILNAIQAMPDGGDIRLRTSDLEPRTIEIEISDTGCGIPKDKLKDIFEPFFTTKEEGTGLGLAITRKIIDDHGGEITVVSKVSEGTKFRITLPA